MKQSLYNKPLRRRPGKSLSEQVYEILLHEIVQRRWMTGERMPSFNDLIRLTGLSRYPIQSSLNRLEREGYIEKVRQKGIFVRSTSPKGTSAGTILVIAGEYSHLLHHTGTPRHSQEMGIIDVARFRRILERKGYGMGLAAVDGTEPVSGGEWLADDAGVKGIISMVGREVLAGLGIADSLPVVFLGADRRGCCPCISGDTYAATRLLTRRLVAAGHRQIGLFATSDWPAAALEPVLAGFGDEMGEAGLVVNSKAIELSRSCHPVDLIGIKGYLESFPEQTGIISLDVDNATRIVEYADLVGMSIPGDLSLASMQAGVMRGGRSEQFVGIAYDWPKVLDVCVNLLVEEEDTALISRLLCRPFVWEGGVSIGCPAEKRVALI